jgi:hypothetical protein
MFGQIHITVKGKRKGQRALKDGSYEQLKRVEKTIWNSVLKLKPRFRPTIDNFILRYILDGIPG